jgi:hypothetical protein
MRIGLVRNLRFPLGNPYLAQPPQIGFHGCERCDKVSRHRGSSGASSRILNTCNLRNSAISLLPFIGLPPCDA